MASDQRPEGAGFGRRLEKWVRESADLRAWVDQARGVPVSPETAALRRYQRSRTKDVALPHPALTPRAYDALGDRRRVLVQRVLAASVAVPLLITLGVLLGPALAQVAAWALLLPVIGLLAHDVRALAVLDRERHLTLRGGLADAWSDWVRARATIDALEHASQARAALGVNDARMQHLVLALGRAESRPDHRDTEEHRASRAWVYDTAAKAVALAEAERHLEVTTRLQVDAGELQVAPDGDGDALDHALDAARQIARGIEGAEPGDESRRRHPR